MGKLIADRKPKLILARIQGKPNLAPFLG